MDALNQRIQAIVEASGHSARGFAKHVGISSTGLQHVLNGRNRPGADLLTGIPRAYPGVSAAWLLTGEGQAFLHSPIDEPTVPSRRITAAPLRSPRLPATGGSTADGFGMVYDEHLYVPAVAQRSYAAGFTATDQAPVGVWVLDLPCLRKPGRTFEVADDSMAPVFASGDYVVCKRVKDAQQVREGCAYVFVSAAAGVSVGYGRLAVDRLVTIPLNQQAYSPVGYLLEDLREVWQVEWHITRRFFDLIAPGNVPGIAQQVDEIREWLGHKFPDFPAGT